MTVQRRTLIRWLCLASLAGALNNASARVADNPYEAISNRNSFKLRTMVQTPPQTVSPARPPADVRLTGVTNLGGKKRALLEIQEPGQPTRKPILTEGEVCDAVELLTIDIDRSAVTMRINGAESSLTLLDWKKPGTSRTSPEFSFSSNRPKYSMMPSAENLMVLATNSIILKP